MDFEKEQQPMLRSMAKPIKNAVDKYQLLPEFLKVRGLVKQHLDSFNYFVTCGIKKIMRANDKIECKFDSDLYLRYNDIYIGEPVIVTDFKPQQLTPQKCRLTDTTYSAPIYVDVTFTSGNQKPRIPKIKKKIIIGRIPIMLRSCHCVLNGKDEFELAKLGECPLDPGGYFVVKGAEKVILIQEQLSKNRIIIETDYKGRVSASVTTSSTQGVKSKTVFFMEKDKIYLQLNTFVKPIPIVVVLKAMGMESEQDIVQMLGSDPKYGSLLQPSLLECSSEDIHSKQQALAFLGSKVGNQVNPGILSKEEKAKYVLLQVFLGNVPITDDNIWPKCLYTGVMLRRMMDAIINTDTFDDKDYVGNKRLELSGQLVSLLFEDLFKTMNTTAVAEINKAHSKTARSTNLDFIPVS
ncbi:hypothetical protein ZOSMA_243G00040 [Zostera marina]|uniref:DNA-directed RNA polymerase n=1 Tax=Zostera marina TaxID=29655 RepID=A0A0K9PJ52_ZOSMR|nr:hypothetical protein ZOSMA_243G00040 [Zostera marina]